MSGLRTVMTAGLALAIASLASAQERFLFDNLAYTAVSPVGPVTFSESQFPTNSKIDGKSINFLNATSLPATLRFTFTVYGGSWFDATVQDFTGYLLPSGVLDDMVEGTTAGILHIDFGTNVTSVSFGFGLSSTDYIASACTVTAYNSSGNPVGSSTSSADVDPFYIGGTAGFASSTAFRSIDVKFASTFPDRIPALNGWGLALLAGLVGLAGATLLRRTAA